MQYLLDTNTCILVMRNHAPAIQRMSAVSPQECSISTVTTFELYTGVEKCSNPTKERAKVELLLRTIQQLPFDTAAATEAARIRAILESQGQIIGPYDMLLAGQALTMSLTIVSANVNEFKRVPGLMIENWQS